MGKRSKILNVVLRNKISNQSLFFTLKTSHTRKSKIKQALGMAMVGVIQKKLGRKATKQELIAWEIKDVETLAIN